MLTDIHLQGQLQGRALLRRATAGLRPNKGDWRAMRRGQGMLHVQLPGGWHVRQDDGYSGEGRRLVVRRCRRLYHRRYVFGISTETRYTHADCRHDRYTGRSILRAQEGPQRRAREACAVLARAGTYPAVLPLRSRLTALPPIRTHSAKTSCRSRRRRGTRSCRSTRPEAARGAAR